MLADQFAERMVSVWLEPGNTSALQVAQQLGAELHPAKGGTTIVEFQDGSFALVTNNGIGILATWLEEDAEIPVLF